VDAAQADVRRRVRSPNDMTADRARHAELVRRLATYQ